MTDKPIIEILAHAGLIPFWIAFAFMMLLLIAEVFIGIGGELDADLGGDLGDVDFGADGIASSAEVTEAVSGLSQSDINTLAPDMFIDGREDMNGKQASSFASYIGLAGSPMHVWLAAFCGSFSIIGTGVQLWLLTTFSFALNPYIAVAVVLFPSLWLTRHVTRIFRTIVPSVETYAVSARAFSRRFGYVTVGTARRGSPANIRYMDRYGNTQYIMAEPAGDDDEITAGTRVLLMRDRQGHPKIVTSSFE